jgi:hypothetical protein
VWPGDNVTCTGKVTRKYEERDRRYIEGDLVVLTQNNETAIRGSFTAELPARA